MTQTQLAMTGPQVSRPSDPLAILSLAVERGADPDQLEKLLALQERYERNQAAKAFGDAFAEFQRLCPAIRKERAPTSGPSYTYASFDDVMRVAAPLLAQCKLSVSFSTEQNEKSLTIVCRVRHGTHCEEATFSVPVPDMRVNDAQKYGAALSYAKRYAICAALNIVVTDEDDDAEGLIETITMEQEAQLEEWIANVGANRPKFLEWLGVAKLGDCPASKFKQAIAALKERGKK